MITAKSFAQKYAKILFPKGPLTKVVSFRSFAPSETKVYPKNGPFWSGYTEAEISTNVMSKMISYKFCHTESSAWPPNQIWSHLKICSTYIIQIYTHHSYTNNDSLIKNGQNISLFLVDFCTFLPILEKITTLP